MKKFALLFFIVSTSLESWAQKDPDLRTETIVGDYKIRHIVFNSTFVLPDVAKIYGIKRSKYESLINVSIAPVGREGSFPGLVTGSITNLMQQQKSLTFKEIKEENAVYYIAPIRVGNEELLRFSLTVKPADSEEAFVVEFKQTVYADE